VCVCVCVTQARSYQPPLVLVQHYANCCLNLALANHKFPAEGNQSKSQRHSENRITSHLSGTAKNGRPKSGPSEADSRES
jgi:hypothetical protein